MIKALKTSLATIALIGEMLGSYSAAARRNTGDAVMYGVIHTDGPAYAKVGLELHQRRTEGYHYLAIETTPKRYALLEDYINGREDFEDVSRKVNPDRLNLFFLYLLKTAKQEGYTLIPIDTQREYECRDKELFNNLRQNLPAGEKVVIVVGAWHTNEQDRIYPMSGQLCTPLGKYLHNYTQGKNQTILVHSACIYEIDQIPEFVPHPDKTIVLPCE